MPPKKDTNGAETIRLLNGFEDKETKLLAAAFLSSIGPDKFDYDLMAVLTGNTNGSLKKMWPPVKKKAIDAHPSFASFLGSTGANIMAASGDPKTPAPPKAKATGGRKRKAADKAEIEDEADTKDVDAKPVRAKSEKSDGNKSDNNKSDSKAETKKKAPAAKGKRGAKKAKKDELSEEQVKSEVDSADGGDGLGQYTRKEKVLKWLGSTDDNAEAGNEVEEEV
ncbi:hypothetical protein BKA63DRAFT_495671 [Paraphoma chrysanthemicola]|nr:hypothetical protein BKA63DRAFT_495671 [Paraphoma chrysanthemicola]